MYKIILNLLIYYGHSLNNLFINIINMITLENEWEEGE